MRKTLEQFIEDAQIIHKDKYDYSKVEYVNNNTKVRIICKNHGIFKILPTNFLSNSGCKKCAFEKLSKDRSLDKNEFIQKAKEIHCDKYDYSLVDYKNNYTKVIIICPIHSEFEQTPVTHLKKSGCKKCGNINSANKQIMSFLDFKTKADLIFNKKYIYNENTWINRNQLTLIICPIHGLFKQKPRDHLRHTTGCSNCKTYRYSSLKRNDFIEKYNNKNCTLYLIKCWNHEEEFYKIGITGRTIKERFHSFERMPYNYEIINKFINEADVIWDIETKVKLYFSKDRYNPKIKFNGSKFECFKVNPINFIEERIEEDY